jgi:hypothetical protein
MDADVVPRCRLVMCSRSTISLKIPHTPAGLPRRLHSGACIKIAESETGRYSNQRKCEPARSCKIGASSHLDFRHSDIARPTW